MEQWYSHYTLSNLYNTQHWTVHGSMPVAGMHNCLKNSRFREFMSLRFTVHMWEVGGFQHWTQIAWLLLGLAIERRKPLVGSGWAISLLLCTNRLSLLAM